MLQIILTWLFIIVLVQLLFVLSAIMYNAVKAYLSGNGKKKTINGEQKPKKEEEKS